MHILLMNLSQLCINLDTSPSHLRERSFITSRGVLETFIHVPEKIFNPPFATSIKVQPSLSQCMKSSTTPSGKPTPTYNMYNMIEYFHEPAACIESKI